MRLQTSRNTIAGTFIAPATLESPQNRRGLPLVTVESPPIGLVVPVQDVATRMERKEGKRRR
jgi:hypothetical protein